ncbi:MAG: ORF6N domain-containing protein [Arcobacteraceae bacterium]
MFQLTNKEKEEVVAKCDHLDKLRFSPVLPYVFTEQGVYMLATILKSKIAVDVNISIMRTFTKLKNLSVPYFDLIKRLESLETDNKQTKELLNKVVQVVSSMQELQNEAKEESKKVGFI